MLLEPELAWSPLPSISLIQPLQRLGLSERDRRIIELARRKLGGTTIDFAAALAALRAAVEELIPAGRTFLLGTTEFGPIVGSIVSGVGITAAASSVDLLRVERDGRRTRLGSFLP